MHAYTIWLGRYSVDAEHLAFTLDGHAIREKFLEMHLQEPPETTRQACSDAVVYLSR